MHLRLPFWEFHDPPQLNRQFRIQRNGKALYGNVGGAEVPARTRPNRGVWRALTLLSIFCHAVRNGAKANRPAFIFVTPSVFHQKQLLFPLPFLLTDACGEPPCNGRRECSNAPRAPAQRVIFGSSSAEGERPVFNGQLCSPSRFRRSGWGRCGAGKPKNRRVGMNRNRSRGTELVYDY